MAIRQQNFYDAIAYEELITFSQKIQNAKIKQIKMGETFYMLNLPSSPSITYFYSNNNDMKFTIMLKKILITNFVNISRNVVTMNYIDITNNNNEGKQKLTIWKDEIPTIDKYQNSIELKKGLILTKDKCTVAYILKKYFKTQTYNIIKQKQIIYKTYSEPWQRQFMKMYKIIINTLKKII